MFVTAAGDLARSLMLRRQSAELKTALSRSAEELTTGRVARPFAHLGGNVGPLAAIERDRQRLAAHATAGAELALQAAGQQAVLARISDEVAAASGQFLALGEAAPGAAVGAVARIGRGAFEGVLSALNGRVADRSLFAGAATDRAAVAPAAAVIDAMMAEVGGATTVEELETAVAAWFAPPDGGFDAVGYTGSDLPLGPVMLGPGDSVTSGVTAARAELRPALAGLAMAAAIDAGALGGDPAARARALERAGVRLAEGLPPLAALAGEVGAIEARAEAAATRGAAEAAALDLARADLIGVDPYEAAARLEDVRGRIEALFTITARLQRLSLTEFLR